jgi:hypothetical protein
MAKKKSTPQRTVAPTVSEAEPRVPYDATPDPADRDQRRMTPIQRESERVQRDPGSLEEETLAQDAPYNKTYGGRKTNR